MNIYSANKLHKGAMELEAYTRDLASLNNLRNILNRTSNLPEAMKKAIDDNIMREQEIKERIFSPFFDRLDQNDFMVDISLYAVDKEEKRISIVRDELPMAEEDIEANYSWCEKLQVKNYEVEESEISKYLINSRVSLNEVNFAAYVIRKLNPDEMKIYLSILGDISPMMMYVDDLYLAALFVYEYFDAKDKLSADYYCRYRGTCLPVRKPKEMILQVTDFENDFAEYIIKDILEAINTSANDSNERECTLKNYYVVGNTGPICLVAAPNEKVAEEIAEEHSDELAYGADWWTATEMDETFISYIRNDMFLGWIKKAGYDYV